MGFIALGNLGAPMAKRLADWPAGLIVFDVRANATTPFAEVGAQVAGTLPEVVVDDIISAMVVNDQQVRDLAAELAAHARPDTAIAIHSKINHNTAAELARDLKANDIHLIDAPVS